MPVSPPWHIFIHSFILNQIKQPIWCKDMWHIQLWSVFNVFLVVCGPLRPLIVLCPALSSRVAGPLTRRCSTLNQLLVLFELTRQLAQVHNSSLNIIHAIRCPWLFVIWTSHFLIKSISFLCKFCYSWRVAVLASISEHRHHYHYCSL